MMQPESLVKLIAGGNTGTLEDEWMRLIEAPDIPPEELAKYDQVLAGLCELKKVSEAVAYACTAIEALSGRLTAKEVLTVGRAFLLVVKESEELRTEVSKLYRAAFNDCVGLEELLALSGVGGGRPVRRAVRTLDVCLPLSEGDYLVARDEDGAARVEQIDRSAWDVTISAPGGSETLDAVRLADRYKAASGDEFAVLRQFDPQQLIVRLKKEPASVVIELCRRQDNRLDSETLESLLVPDLIPDAGWKKWWTQARSALRRDPNVQIDGRSPYYLTYSDDAVTFEDVLKTEFAVARGPMARLDAVQGYLRVCRSRKETPSGSAIRPCFDSLVEQASRLTNDGADHAGLWWIIARYVGEAGVLADASEGAVRFFGATTDVPGIFGSIEHDSLLDVAFSSLVEGRPDDWKEQLIALFPALPLAGCDRATTHLMDAGWKPSDFEPIVQRIMAEPVEHFEALSWLWNGPSEKEIAGDLGSVTLLTRMLGALEQSRLDDAVPKETAKRIGTRARNVLSARKFERFLRCLDELEAGMAAALLVRIGRLDNLGQAVREDMLSFLRLRFASPDSQPTIKPWEREDVLYCTEEGLVRKRKELEHHINVKIRDNARAIGEAAAKGDLSENSEYKFALEERDLLQARLAMMNAEIAIARVLDPEDVPTDHVGVGTKVVLKRVDDGEVFGLSFIGPWEADPDRQILNYLAPLSLSLMGGTIGDTVELDITAAKGTYEIVALENALTSD